MGGVPRRKPRSASEDSESITASAVKFPELPSRGYGHKKAAFAADTLNEAMNLLFVKPIFLLL
ncbi:TPA: hypothetical protein JD340_24830 [Citrobacter freundii]|nr:hypothetical protein [Citrobacter freundii]